ncbi:hypothetical protein HG530_002572 [Fusarium avenaceum]|nr:hypothetical protein HG530_002572 [Fusarium avenaceum]
MIAIYLFDILDIQVGFPFLSLGLNLLFRDSSLNLRDPFGIYCLPPSARNELQSPVLFFEVLKTFVYWNRRLRTAALYQILNYLAILDKNVEKTAIRSCTGETNHVFFVYLVFNGPKL